MNVRWERVRFRVLSFHGNNSDASMQSSAVVMRRALLEAGLVVLAVDHPGYGQSPAPSPEAEVAAWDPLPTALAAVDALRSRPEVDRIFALGYSMGARQVLRLLNAQSEMSGAVLFGAALGDNEVRFEEYWYERFHTERGMREWIPPERYLEIRNRFEVTGPRSVASLPVDHPTVLFVRFGHEWPNIVTTRDALYGAIPGRKTTWDLAASTHYFSSYRTMDLVIGDIRVMRSLASSLRLLAAELAAGAYGNSPGNRVGGEVLVSPSALEGRAA